jgi:hypothetical protein
VVKFVFITRSLRLLEAGRSGEGWMFDAGCLMLDAGCWMLDVGCWMLDVGCWMLDAGCWMLDVGCLASESFAVSREINPGTGNRLFCIAVILAALSGAIRFIGSCSTRPAGSGVRTGQKKMRVLFFFSIRFIGSCSTRPAGSGVRTGQKKMRVLFFFSNRKRQWGTGAKTCV